eukprot:g24714.t1
MSAEELKPDTISYSATISACQKGWKWQQALNLFLSMPTAAVELDTICYSATMSACEKGKQWQKAMMLLDEMKRSKILPDVISYNACISALEKGKQWRQAVLLFEEMTESTHKRLGVDTFTAIIGACGKGNQWQQALLIFEEMPKANVQRDVISYNAIILACERGQQWMLALKLYEPMPKAELQHGVVGVTDAMVIAPSELLKLFEAMLRAKVQPDIRSHIESLIGREEPPDEVRDRSSSVGRACTRLRTALQEYLMYHFWMPLTGLVAVGSAFTVQPWLSICDLVAA